MGVLKGGGASDNVALALVESEELLVAVVETLDEGECGFEVSGGLLGALLDGDQLRTKADKGSLQSGDFFGFHRDGRHRNGRWRFRRNSDFSTRFGSFHVEWRQRNTTLMSVRMQRSGKWTDKRMQSLQLLRDDVARFGTLHTV